MFSTLEWSKNNLKRHLKHLFRGGALFRRKKTHKSVKTLKNRQSYTIKLDCIALKNRQSYAIKFDRI